ncbi:MAG TPA: FecR domain-containing protein [Polyangiaceae bacterium]|jgi:ferric-dicitrate binding protein FerR (iron transport regulator)|nr:FecR domain-containing protein [Polyangiaceae bacterium]
MSRNEGLVEHDAGAENLAALPRALDGSVSDAEHAAGRERLMVSFGTRTRTTPWRLVALAAALVVSVAAGVAVFLVQRPAPELEYRVTGPVVTDGGWLGVPADRGALSLRFSEGTEIDLGPGSKGKVESVTADGARVVLGTGLLRARVVHRPRTHWAVMAGPYSIEVTGTAFDVGWSTSGERLELCLHDGSVIVRGPSLRDGLRVAAGQRLVAHARTGGAELSSLFAPEAAAETPSESPRAVEPSNTTEPLNDVEAPGAAEPSSAEREPGDSVETPPAHPSPSWSEMLASGNFRGVIESAESRGVGNALNRGSLADLVALADAARYAHEKALAKRGLLAERTRFPGSAEARGAAFVLGRMADDAGLSAEALHWYDEYLSESPRGSFAAEALGRKLVALVRAGDTGSARSIAGTYLERFPRGAHAAYAREVLSGP